MKPAYTEALASLACGTLFGFGLSLSGMLDPSRVQGFLDVFGAWDPSLMFVLGGAVLVAMIGMLLVKTMARPLLAGCFHMPGKTKIDLPLIIGSAIFGVGWGLGGLCPGPAIAALPMGYGAIVLFVVAMLAGMVIHDRFVAGIIS
ncbi:YeeE/YedE family protein [Rhizobium sp. PDO1-076]|uniref:YeeE/YedE family protein n=1 Tax=Rhizobium sp. PDO1-076 TaxID=1125979 RepID=UPI0002E1BE51|nr:YeeE/YedE family protein [Rhizobium sp. PDO1-076]